MILYLLEPDITKLLVIVCRMLYLLLGREINFYPFCIHPFWQVSSKVFSFTDFFVLFAWFLLYNVQKFPCACGSLVVDIMIKS